MNMKRNKKTQKKSEFSLVFYYLTTSYSTLAALDKLA